MKKILSILIILSGNAIIHAAFLAFGDKSKAGVLALNMTVSSVVYGMMVFLIWRTLRMDLNDKSQKRIGALGIVWFAAGLYSLLAVATMLAANLATDLSFPVQLIIHCVLLFLYLLGAMAAHRSSNKTAEVHERETARRSGTDEMKAALRSLRNKISDADNLPDSLARRVDSLIEELRFVSPSGSSEAQALERSFVETAAEMTTAVSSHFGEERIEKGLRRCEHLCSERKNIK
ncbi:MAG: hypothetical protein LBD35_04265 [Prevotellaceae bacterium]|nr:hypothetical protein [Prevotellaceae bacterium]